MDLSIIRLVVDLRSNQPFKLWDIVPSNSAFVEIFYETLMKQPGHQFDATILRQYDLRGIVGQTLSVSDALALGQTLGAQTVGSGGKLAVVGFDGRLSSPVLEEELVRGLGSAGLSVVRIGLVPTPAVYFLSHMINANLAVMVTGSHNPANYNGFKIMLNNQPFFGEAIQNMAMHAFNGNWIYEEGVVMHANVNSAYADRLLAEYAIDDGLRVAWDFGNGAAGPIMMQCIEQMPGEHFIINDEVDGTFPAHHPDPTVVENLQQLRDLVAEEACDVGIGFDGDGDRIGVVDDEGEIIWGDQLMIIYAREILAETPGARIIADVKASQTLFDEITKLGGEPIMAATGHSIIKSEMRKVKALLAGEMSGHIFFSDRYLGYDDALYAAMRLLRILAQSGRKLSDLRKTMPKAVNTPEIRVEIDETQKFKVMEAIKKQVIASGVDVNLTDGIRVKDARGWWLIRASNTQNCLVMRAEAQNQENLDEILQDIRQILRQYNLSFSF